MNNEINAVQKAIDILISEGYTILQAVQPSGETLYFVVYRWQEGYFNSTQSVDYNSVEGINITDFMVKHSNMYLSKSVFLENFRKVLDESSVVRCEFTKTSIWYKWSMVSK